MRQRAAGSPPRQHNRRPPRTQCQSEDEARHGPRLARTTGGSPEIHPFSPIAERSRFVGVLHSSRVTAAALSATSRTSERPDVHPCGRRHLQARLAQTDRDTVAFPRPTSRPDGLRAECLERRAAGASPQGRLAAPIAAHVEPEMPCQACPKGRFQDPSWTCYVERVVDVNDVAKPRTTGRSARLLGASWTCQPRESPATTRHHLRCST
jgi:hypothetical protein